MDTGIVEGSTISMYYDPMISKVSLTSLVSRRCLLCVNHELQLSFELRFFVHDMNYSHCLCEQAN